MFTRLLGNQKATVHLFRTHSPPRGLVCGRGGVQPHKNGLVPVPNSILTSAPPAPLALRELPGVAVKLEPGLGKLFDPAPAPFPPAELGKPGTIRADDPPPPEASDEEAARMVPMPRLAGASLRGAAAAAEGMEVSRDGEDMRLLPPLLLLDGLGTPGLPIPAAVAGAAVAVSGFGVGGGAIGCGGAGGAGQMTATG